MITKIKINDTERYAIILSDHSDLEEIQSYSSSLISLIGRVCDAKDSEAWIDDIYRATNLINELQPTTEQALFFQKMCFGSRYKSEKAEPTPCEIWLQPDQVLI